MQVDRDLVEAAYTLGADARGVVRRVLLPGSAPAIAETLRLVLGWAWTYLIVAELIGATSGISFFITQQARYRNFENVYAAIMMIGIIGFGTDILLGKLGYRLFPWDRSQKKA